MLANRSREGGWLLLEIMIAVTILTVGILGFLLSFHANFRATQEVEIRDRANVAIASVVETLRETPFDSVYGTYNNTFIPVYGLPGPTMLPYTPYTTEPYTTTTTNPMEYTTTAYDVSPSSSSSVWIQFFVNETALPYEFGPIADLDGDGVKLTTTYTADYALLPIRLSLTYQMPFGPETKVADIILRR